MEEKVSDFTEDHNIKRVREESQWSYEKIKDFHGTGNLVLKRGIVKETGREELRSVRIEER